MEQGLLTPGQAADLLGVPLSWIYTKAENGELPSRKIGRYRRFVGSELSAWVERHREGPAPIATRERKA